jgi:hypothetical protein
LENHLLTLIQKWLPIFTHKNNYVISQKKSVWLTCNLFLGCIQYCIENKSRTLINGDFYLLNFNIIIQCPFTLKRHKLIMLINRKTISCDFKHITKHPSFCFHVFDTHNFTLEMPYKMENVAVKIGLQSCFMMKMSHEYLMMQQATKLLFLLFPNFNFFVPNLNKSFFNP